MFKGWMALLGAVFMLVAAVAASESVEFWNLEYSENSGRFAFKIENVGTEDIELGDTYLYLENDKGDTIDLRFPLEETLYRDDILDVEYESWNPFFENSCEVEKKIRVSLTNKSEGRDVISARYKYLYCEDEELQVRIDTYPEQIEEGKPLVLHGTVERNGTRAALAKIVVQTSWGQSVVDYSSTSGTFMVSLFPPAGEHWVKLFFSYRDLEATREVKVKSGGFKVVADAYPRLVEKGDTTEIIGRVTRKGIGVRDVYVEMVVGKEVYFATTNLFGEFSRKVGVGKAGDTKVEITAHKEGLEGNMNFTISAEGEESDDITINLPVWVKPGRSFRVSGTYLVDGEEVSRTARVKFNNQYTSFGVEKGSYSFYLDAPESVGCYLVEIEGAGREICVMEHASIRLDYSLEHRNPGDNSITYTAKYEDGSFVKGVLYYGFGSKQGSIEVFEGVVTLPANFGEGRYYSFARVSDRMISSEKVVKELVIGNPKPDGPIFRPDVPSEEEIGPEPEVVLLVAGPEKLELYAGEKTVFRVDVENVGEKAVEAEVIFGKETKSLVVDEKASVEFGVVGEKDETLVVQVRSGDFLRELKVEVFILEPSVFIGAAFPSEDYSYFIPYEVGGFGSKKIRTSLFLKNGTLLEEREEIVELPIKAGSRFTLEEGEYDFCVQLDDVERCEFVKVRQEIGITAAMGVGIFFGVLALLLLF